MTAEPETSVLDRLRSLPMSQDAVLLGRTTPNLAASAIDLLAMSVFGLTVRKRIHSGVLDAVVAYMLLPHMISADILNSARECVPSAPDVSAAYSIRCSAET